MNSMERDQRIRERAHRIWENEGRPEGRADDHWKLAAEEIAIEDNQDRTLKPNPLNTETPDPRGGEPVESVESVKSQGDVPGLRDQGDESAPPRRRRGGR